MSNVIRYDLLVADVTSLLTAEHELDGSLQRILDQAVLGVGAATGSLLVRGEGADPAQLVAISGGGEPADALHLQTSIGPAADCVLSSSIVLADNLTDDSRWPTLASLAQQAGVQAVRAYPVRLSGRPIGALTLYTAQAWGAERPSHLGQTMADLAAVAIGLESARATQESVAARIRELISDRVAVNLASGMLSQFLEIDVAQAHARLLARAAETKVPAATLAVELINDRNTLNDF